MSAARASLGATLLVLLLASGALASWTAPPLALTRADTVPGTLGTLLRLRGTFPAGDLVARPYALQVFVRHRGLDARFVLFSGAWAAVQGVVPDQVDGTELELVDLDAELLESILTAGTPVWGDGVTHVGPTRIEVMLPADFPSGPADVVLFVMYEGEPVVSNPLEFTIEVAP